MWTGISEALAQSPEQIISATMGQGGGMPPTIGIQIIVWVIIALVQTVVFSIVGTWWVRNLIDSIRSEIRNERKEVDLVIATLENDMRDRIDGAARDLSQKIDSSHSLHDREINKTRDDLHQLAYHVRDTYARRESIKSISEDLKGVFQDGISRIERAVTSK